MYAPDTLSGMLARNRNTVHRSNNVDDFHTETEVFVCSILDEIPVSDVKLQQIGDSQDQDEVCKTLRPCSHYTRSII